jgi:hypothetical protein
MSTFVDTSTSEGEENGTVKQVQTELIVGGSTLTIICSTYADRHFIVVTQIDKIGTLVTGKAVAGIDGTVHYEVNILFGKRDDQLLLVYCRQIVEKIYKAGSSKPVLLAISLLEEGHSVECFQAVLNKLDEIATW